MNGTLLTLRSPSILNLNPNINDSFQLFSAVIANFGRQAYGLRRSTMGLAGVRITKLFPIHTQDGTAYNKFAQDTISCTNGISSNSTTIEYKVTTSVLQWTKSTQTRKPTNWWGNAKCDITHPTATGVYNICYHLF